MKLPFAIRNSENKYLEVKIISIVPTPGTLAFVRQYGTRCNLKNNQSSAPYTEYIVRPVDHLIYGSVQLGGTIGITLAVTLLEGEICYGLIRQDFVDRGPELVEVAHDIAFGSNDIRLFNYEHYAASRRALGLTVPSIDEHVSEFLQSSGHAHEARRYALEGQRPERVTDLLDEAALGQWLDQEETRTTASMN